MSDLERLFDRQEAHEIECNAHLAEQAQRLEHATSIMQEMLNAAVTDASDNLDLKRREIAALERIAAALDK